jgi:AcrR family transcriptional regulator
MSAEREGPRPPTRLPRGPHGLPREEIARNQRQRLLAAMVRVCGEKGYEATSVADVLETSGVGRETFYELFDDKRDCFLAAHTLLIEDLVAQVRGAYDEGEAPWPQRVRAALTRLLDWLAADPYAARFTVVELTAAGPGYAERFQTYFHALTEILEDGRALSETARDLPHIANIAAAGIFARVYEEVALGHAESLPDLLPTLLFEVLVPFFGEEVAREESERPGGTGQAAA